MSDLPNSWEWARLDQIADVRLGRQRSPKNHSGTDMRPYLRAANVGWNGLKLEDVKLMNFTEAELETYRLLPGDIVLSEASGSASEVGKPALWRGEVDDCCFQNTLIRVRSRGVDPTYLLGFLGAEARSGAFVKRSRGVGIYHIGAARLAELQIPVPPIAEQRRIVAALENHVSHLDAGSALLDGIKVSTSRLVDSAIESLDEANVETVELGELVEPGRRIAYGVLVPGPDTPDGIPMVRVGDLLAENIEPSTLKRIDRRTEEKFPRTRLRGGEVLMSLVGTIGRVAVAPQASVGCNTARAVGVFPLDLASVNPHWVVAMIRSRAMNRHLNKVANEVARKTLNLEDAKRCRIPVPPRDQQDELILKINYIRTYSQRLRSSCTAIGQRGDRLRRSLLADAFTGRLMPQNPSDEPASILLDRIRIARAAQPKTRSTGRAAQ